MRNSSALAVESRAQYGARLESECMGTVPANWDVELGPCAVIREFRLSCLCVRNKATTGGQPSLKDWSVVGNKICHRRNMQL